MKYDQPKLNVLTDHIGMFERSVPVQRWRAIALLMLTVVVIATGAWEIKMRSLGLHAGDLDDGKSYWAVERRKVDSGPRDQVVIIGDSRSLFDNNLDVWQQVSGLRPIQLGLIGTNPRPFLEDLANDEHFSGLVVAAFSEGSFFSNDGGLNSGALTYWRSESPSQRAGHSVQLFLSERFAFLDSRYSLFALLGQLDIPNRPQVPWMDMILPKMYESFADRQTAMWPRLENDVRIRDQVRNAWIKGFPDDLAAMRSTTEPLIREIIATTKRDIDKIRSRGGEVVLVRPPSNGPDLENERAGVPREKRWNPLVSAAGVYSVHFEDYPEMQGLELPEWSHLSADSAKKFTHAYVAVLCKHVPWLKQHGGKCAAEEQDVSRP